MTSQPPSVKGLPFSQRPYLLCLSVLDMAGLFDFIISVFEFFLIYHTASITAMCRYFNQLFSLLPMNSLICETSQITTS